MGYRDGASTSGASLRSPAASLPMGASAKSTPSAATAADAVWSALDDVTPGLKRSQEANLFDLGVDSLACAELVLRLQDLFGETSISVDDVMDDPTVKHIASLLAAAADADSNANTGAEDDDTYDAADVLDKVWDACEQVAPGIRTASAKAGGLSASLFDLGIDSLACAEVVTTIQDIFGEDSITVDDIMDDPTVGGIVARVTPMKRAGSRSGASPAPVSTLFPVAAAGVVGAGNVLDFTSGSADDDEVPTGVATWIMTTHVGSLPRPGRDEDSDPRAVIRRQLDLGIDFVNDGEWGRDNYVSSLVERLGLSAAAPSPVASKAGDCGCIAPCAADMRDVPLYAKRFTAHNGLITLNPERPVRCAVVCEGPLTPASSASPDPALTNLVGALPTNGPGRPRGGAFYTCPSPGTVAGFCEDRHYGDYGKFITALADAMRPEFESVVASGALLQVDAPDLAMGRHSRFAHLSDSEWMEVAEMNAAAINRALGGIHPSRVRVHVCWGNYPGPHHRDIGVEGLWPVLSKLRCKYLLVEGANSRHAHEWASVTASSLRPDQVLVPGVIDTKAPNVEHPRLICERLMHYASVLGPHRVMAGTDCGFASTAGSTAITADVAWLKMASLVEGARLATEAYVNLNAPFKSPVILRTTGIRAVLIAGPDHKEQVPAAAVDALRGSVWAFHHVELGKGQAPAAIDAISDDLRWAIDLPIVFVAVGAQASAAAAEVSKRLAADNSMSRRPSVIFTLGVAGAAGAAMNSLAPESLGEVPRTAADARVTADALKAAASRALSQAFDKRVLVPVPASPAAAAAGIAAPPAETEVLIVGAGLLGLYAAHRLTKEGFNVAVVEQRMLIGGIWSMYANSTSQVNSSEGGYSLKSILGTTSAAPADEKNPSSNRDHSTAAEILKDVKALGDTLPVDTIRCGIKVLRVTPIPASRGGGYEVMSLRDEQTFTTRAKGVILAINDRVGIPRSLQVPGMPKFRGVMTDGIADNLAGMDWVGKDVIVAGMGAFAVENVRTALEHGARSVTVVCRRHGTVCPKIIDYLNFVKPFDEQYRHSPITNIKQMQQWSKLYKKSGATIPETWPKKIKHDGHTISVSDLWFVAHHMGKLRTTVGEVESMYESGAVITNGERIPADIVIGCIGFVRNTTLCEALTGMDDVGHSNYLSRDLMYLADAEIDEGAFNSFFGSSVLEYGKFFTEVFIEGLRNPAGVGEMLWGDSVPRTPIHDRKWSQYIAAGARLIANNDYIRDAAATQVAKRTKHFLETLPPAAYVAANRLEWEELHTRLNGGVPVPKADQLPYQFDMAADWC